MAGSRNVEELRTGQLEHAASADVPTLRWTETGRIRRQEQHFPHVTPGIGADGGPSVMSKHVRGSQIPVGNELLPAPVVLKQLARSYVCTPGAVHAGCDC